MMTLDLFNLQTMLLFYVDMNQEKQLQQKFFKKLLKTGSYLKENQLTVNADKTELFYFSTRDELDPKKFFNENLIKSAENSLSGIYLASKLTFEAHLKIVLKQITAAIRSLYLLKKP